MVQQQYWTELHELKTHIIFIELQLEKSETKDRYIKMILAVASSSSIGAWAIWQSLSLVWGGIIALSQVISAINPFLPYQNRMKAYSSLINELEEIMIHAELKWHAIAQGKLTEEEINTARFEIRKEKQKAINKHIQTTIPENAKLHTIAEQKSSDYLNNYYSTQD